MPRAALSALCGLLIMLTVSTPLLAQTDLTRPFVPDPQTVHLLHLDDVGTGQCADAAGGPAGVITSGKATLGRFSGGLSLDGAKGWVDLTPLTSAAPDQAVTVECWAKFRSHARGDLICRNMAYMMRLNGGITALFAIDGKWRHITGARPVPVGRWVHLTMTYDQADGLVRIYIDGRLDVARKPEDISAGKLDRGENLLRIGTNTWNPGAGTPDGVIDEVRVSSVARTYRPLPQPGAAPVPANVNLLPNPGFELGHHGWRPEGEGDGTLQWQIVTGEAPEGRQFLRSTEDRAYSLISYPVAVSPGQTHTFSVALRADKAVSSHLTLLSTGLAPEAKLTGRSETAKVTTEWQRFSLKYDLPADFPGNRVYARIEKPAGARLDIDAASLMVGDSAEFVPSDANLFGAALQLPPGNTFALGEAAKIPVQVFNNSNTPRKVTVNHRLLDWRGEGMGAINRATTAPAIFAGMLPPGISPATISLPTKSPGWFTLVIDTTVDDKPGSRVPYVINVVEPMTGRGDAFASPLGMNTHMEREPGAHLQHNLGTLARCGVKWIRAWWGWGMAEKQPGQFDWSEYDRQYNDVHAAGMEIMPILLRYYPQYEQAWAGKTDTIQQPPYNLQQWGNFVETTVRRYKGRIRAWEVWNEPCYNMDAKTYAGILKTTYERIKAADPDALVVGFAGVPLDFIRDTFEAGGAQNLDVLSHHSYSQLVQPFLAQAKLQSDTLELLKASNLNLPVWHSEQGSGADGAGYLGMAATEEACAINLLQSYLSTLATGVEKFFWFSAQTSQTYGWGVFYENYIPRPRLVALNGLARLMQGRQAVPRPVVLAVPGVAAVLLDGEAGPAAALWNLRDPLSLSLSSGRGLQATDMFCNLATPPGWKFTLRLEKGRPVYVLAKGLTLDQLEERLQNATIAAPDELPFEVTLAREGDKLTITVHNTGDERLDVDLQLASPLLRAAARTIEIRDLRPGDIAPQTLLLTPQRARGRRHEVQITATVGGAELHRHAVTRQVRW